MITVFYIGEARFADITRTNHEQLFDLLRQNWPIEIMDFTHHTWDRSACPFDRSGAIQIWDFYQCLKKVKSDIVIKLRTDIFFGPGSAEAVLKEVSKIVNDEQDSSFIGGEWRHSYDEIYRSTPAVEESKVQDFIVAAHRRGLRSEEDVMHQLNTGKPFKSGSKTWHAVYLPESRAHTVKCQMSLVRQHYDVPEWWQVTYDYLRTCRGVDESITWWLLNKPRTAKEFVL